ncbi:hypothetical protein JCM6882_006383 [Rhodosporidiobolus microsporus]
MSGHHKHRTDRRDRREPNAVSLIIRHVFEDNGVEAGNNPLFRFREIKKIYLDMALTPQQKLATEARVGVAKVNLGGLFEGRTSAVLALVPSSETVKQREELVKAKMGVRQDSAGQGYATQIAVVLATGLADNDLADLLKRRSNALDPRYRWAVNCFGPHGHQINGSLPCYTGAPLFLVLVQDAIDYSDGEHRKVLQVEPARMHDLHQLLWMRRIKPGAIPFFSNEDIASVLARCVSSWVLDAQEWAEQAIGINDAKRDALGHDYLEWWEEEHCVRLHEDDYKDGLRRFRRLLEEISELLHLHVPPPPPPRRSSSFAPRPLYDNSYMAEPEEFHPFDPRNPVYHHPPPPPAPFSRPPRPPRPTYPPMAGEHLRGRGRSNSQHQRYAPVAVDPGYGLGVDDLDERFGGMHFAEGRTQKEIEDELQRERLEERLRPKKHKRRPSRMR